MTDGRVEPRKLNPKHVSQPEDEGILKVEEADEKLGREYRGRRTRNGDLSAEAEEEEEGDQDEDDIGTNINDAINNIELAEVDFGSLADVQKSLPNQAIDVLNKPAKP